MTAKAAAINEKAQAMIKGLSDLQLFAQWELTGVVNNENIPTVRGWLMDEIESRYPVAFDEWLEGSGEDADLKSYIEKYRK